MIINLYGSTCTKYTRRIEVIYTPRSRPKAQYHRWFVRQADAEKFMQSVRPDSCRVVKVVH